MNQKVNDIDTQIEEAVADAAAESLATEINEEMAASVSEAIGWTEPNAPEHTDAILKQDPDFSDPKELAKAVFIQFSTDMNELSKWQLDEIEGSVTLTSFHFPTAQFLFSPTVDKTIFMAVFPGDDAVATLSIFMDMQIRLAKHGYTIDIGGVIAPHRDEKERTSLVSNIKEVYSIVASEYLIRGKALQKRIESDETASESEGVPEAPVDDSEPETTTEAPAEAQNEPSDTSEYAEIEALDSDKPE